MNRIDKIIILDHNGNKIDHIKNAQVMTQQSSEGNIMYIKKPIEEIK